MRALFHGGAHPTPTLARSPIPVAASLPPAVGAQEMRRLDYWAVREFQLPLVVMMENAGRALADLLRRRYAPERDEPILVLAGKGGNGGGALVAARHLLRSGYSVSVLTTDPAPKLRDDTRRQLSLFRKDEGVAPTHRKGEALPDARYLVDGILGYGVNEAPKEAAAELIAGANAARATRVALDLPSGLHPDTGAPHEPTLRAHATLTLALPKRGLLERAARPFVGELYLADIGLPRTLYGDFDVTPHAIFGDEALVRLEVP